MEVQSECGEPPADPQPTGKINKAAFKLFGKRRSGAGMAGFFSFRNKGAVSNGNPSSSENGHGSAAATTGTAGTASAESVPPAELVRSKTHDGLPMGSDGQGSREALGRGGRGGGGGGGGGGGRGVGGGSLEAVPVRSLSKSFSFFSFLRRGSLRTAESGGAGLARRGRGLKGLFSSMRWRRGRDRTSEAEGAGGGEVAAAAAVAAQADEARAVEVAQVEQGADVTLTLEPLPHRAPEDASGPEPCGRPRRTRDSSPGSASPQYAASVNDAGADSSSPAFPYTPTDSPLHELLGPKARAGSDGGGGGGGGGASLATPQLERCCGAADPPSVDRLCSLLFTDVTSLKSFDSLTGCGDIIADTEEEVLSGANGGSGTSSSSSGGGGGAGGAGTEEGAKGRRTAPTSQGSPARRPLPSSQLTRSSFSSVVAGSAPLPSLPARAQISPPQPEHVTGSGVVAYMGGGEEMASPEGVDDADMQGLWHMLPSTGDNSPALPRPHQGATTAPSVRDRKTPQVKTLGLSKIPVVGAAGSRAAAKPPAAHHHTYGSRQPTSPGEKELLSDEGYWDTPSATPTATPVDEGIQRSERIILSRDSCSGDHLYDLYNDPEEEGKEDDLSSTPSPSTEHKLSPSSQTTPPSSSSSPPSFRSLKGSASLPRDSKIPLSVRQSPPPPPHSVSQSSLPSVLEASAAQPKTQAAPPPARTRIPVSKVPVRRSGQNKPGSASRGTAHRK